MGVLHVPRGRPAGFPLLPAVLLATAVQACAPASRHRQAEAPPPAADPAPPATNEIPRVTDLIVSDTNAFRAEQGRGGVSVNPRLRAAAEDFARYMARTTRYGHTADGKTPAERAQEHGYDYCLVSENIAYQYSSAGFATDALADGFVSGWKQSPEHRRNMLDPDVVETGVAVARSANGTYYAVQMFGRPTSMEVVFKVTNRAGVPLSYTLDGQTYPLPPRVTRTHTVCRPPKIDFAWRKDEGPQGAEGGDVFSPRGGSHYVVTRDAQGKFAVQAQAETAS
jgi:uncharacterized protein YkwD